MGDAAQLVNYDHRETKKRREGEDQEGNYYHRPQIGKQSIGIISSSKLSGGLIDKSYNFDLDGSNEAETSSGMDGEKSSTNSTNSRTISEDSVDFEQRGHKNMGGYVSGRDDPTQSSNSYALSSDSFSENDRTSERDKRSDVQDLHQLFRSPGDGRDLKESRPSYPGGRSRESVNRRGTRTRFPTWLSPENRNLSGEDSFREEEEEGSVAEDWQKVNTVRFERQNYEDLQELEGGFALDANIVNDRVASMMDELGMSDDSDSEDPGDLTNMLHGRGKFSIFATASSVPSVDFEQRAANIGGSIFILDDERHHKDTMSTDAYMPPPPPASSDSDASYSRQRRGHVDPNMRKRSDGQEKEFRFSRIPPPPPPSSSFKSSSSSNNRSRTEPIFTVQLSQQSFVGKSLSRVKNKFSKLKKHSKTVPVSKEVFNGNSRNNRKSRNNSKTVPVWKHGPTRKSTEADDSPLWPDDLMEEAACYKTESLTSSESSSSGTSSCQPDNWQQEL